MLEICDLVLSASSDESRSYKKPGISRSIAFSGKYLRKTPALESKSMARHRQFRAKRTATPAAQNSFRARSSIPANTTSLPILAIAFPIESELDLFDPRIDLKTPLLGADT